MRESLKKRSPRPLPFALILLLLYAAPALCGTLTLDTSPAVSAYFERDKQNEATLIAFLHKMPKGADLHNHPSGAIYTESLVDAAIERNLDYDRIEQAFLSLIHI